MASTTDVRTQRTHIGKAMQFKGEISGNEDVVIDGKVEGVITLPGQSVTVGPNGDVRANVNIRDMTIQGRLEGTVAARERIEIASTGSVTGELSTARIAVHDGAFFKGKIDVVKAREEVRPATPEPARPSIPAAGVSGPKPSPPSGPSSRETAGGSSPD